MSDYDPNYMSPEECAVLDKLVEAHNLYVQLPIQHPLHQQEWVFSLHQLQRLVMSRPTARAEGHTEKVSYQKGGEDA